jgi:acetyl esterase/lipase
MVNGHSGSVEKDIVFGRGGDMELKLDVYRPTGVDKRTAVIHLHGGGFRGGNKEGVLRSLKFFVERGYLGVAAQYRLAHEAKWPAQINDVKAAIRWTRANATSLGVDPDKIAIAGYSAGANLALTAAGTQNVAALEGEGGNAGVSTTLAACVAYYPPESMRRNADGSPHILMPEGATEEDYRQASPITNVSSASPPTILLHATSDTTIPFEHSMHLFEALRAAGVRTELHVYDGLSHVFDRHEEFARPCAELCDLFLDRHVVEPREYPPFAQPQPATAPA